MKKLLLVLSVLFLATCTKENEPTIFTLTTSANPAEGGTVTPKTAKYEEGENATIIATPSSKYVFESWTGVTGTSASITSVMSSDKSVVANFVKKTFKLTVDVEGEGTVAEKIIKSGTVTDYTVDSVIELTATPSDEWLFVEWKGDFTGTENPAQITIDKEKKITAVFIKKQYPLTVNIEGEGTVSEKIIKEGAATNYNSGTIVELTATEKTGWKFKEWSGDLTSNENPVQITVDASKSVKAVFIKKTFAVTTIIEGGGGNVNKKIVSGNEINGLYEYGTVLNITANQGPGFEFSSWKGDLAGTENPVQLTIDKEKSITAVFVKRKFELTLEVEGKGFINETIIKEGASTDYNYGTIVELTATAISGWEFKKWSGDISETTNNPIQITNDSAKTIKAIFVANIGGTVQKGPFLTGTTLNIFELNEDLTQTGKSYTSEIIDDTGQFSISGLNLVSDIVRINASGYYFNEISGENSAAQLSLSLLAKIDSEDPINVNVITALERPRIEYLVKNEQLRFEDAKKKAQYEILKTFGIENNSLESSEKFDITKSGTGNSILLAISSIIQGYRTDAQVSELISNMATDFRQDGELNSVISGSKLLSHAEFLNPSKIKKNIEDKFEQFGKTVNVPDFESIINDFKTNSTFEKNHFPMDYPANGSFGVNILNLDKDNYSAEDLGSSPGNGFQISMRAEMKDFGEIKVKLTSVNSPYWSWDTKTTNATATGFDFNTYSQSFSPVKSKNNEVMDVSMSFCPGKYKVEYYEMGSETVTRTRIVNFDYDLENDFFEISSEKFEKNLNGIMGSCGNSIVDGYFRKSKALNAERLVFTLSPFITIDDHQVVDFSGLEIFTNLKYLDLGNNDAVTQINLSALTNLTDFDALECESLTCIIVSQEQLDNIPSGWQKPSGAEYKLSCE